MNSWSSTDGWRNSNLSVVELILGSAKHSKENKECVERPFKLPEGTYKVSIVFEDYLRWYPRIPKFIWLGKIKRANIDIDPPIPCPDRESGYSNSSFPANNTEEVLDDIYKTIKKRRSNDMSYYSNSYRKIVDNYIYTINDLPIDIGRVVIEKHDKEWKPTKCSTSQISDNEFNRLKSKESDFTPEESNFINKYMGILNSFDFIRDLSQQQKQDEMCEYFKKRNMTISCGAGDKSYAVPKTGSV